MDMPDLSGPQLIADGGLTTELEAQARTRSVPRTSRALRPRFQTVLVGEGVP